MDMILPEVNDVGTVEKIVVADCPRIAHIEPALSPDDLSQVGAATLKVLKCEILISCILMIFLS
jgi:hypothetical protein